MGDGGGCCYIKPSALQTKEIFIIFFFFLILKISLPLQQ